MPAYNPNSTRQLRPRKGQLPRDAPHRLPTASINMASQTQDIIMSEGIITDGPSPATDVDAAIMDAAGSRREDTAPASASVMDHTAPTGDFVPSSKDAAPASTIEETTPGGIRPFTPIEGPTGQLSEDTAAASIMDDTAPTGDFAPSSEDAAPASTTEETVPGGIRPSTPIEGPTGQLSEDAVEVAAPANTIEETIPSDIETSIRDEASTHINVLDPASGKATVDEDSTIVAMDEDTPIPVEKTGGEELSVVSVSAGNVDHDTIIVEEEDARFDLDEEGPQVEMPQSPAAGGSMQPIMIEDDDEQIAGNGGSTQPIVVDESDDEQIDEAPAYIRDIVQRKVSDEDTESEYSDDNSTSGSSRQFSRSSRLQGRLNQLQDNHVGYTIRVLERLIEQIGSRDDGEPENTDHQGRSMDGYLLSEMNATSRTIGSLDYLIEDINNPRKLRQMKTILATAINHMSLRECSFLKSRHHIDEQVRLLAEEGRPDLSHFLDSLESRSIAPSKEISSLRAAYGLEKEPVPQSCLDTALDRVVEGVSHVFGKHSLGENDSVIVDGAVELSGGVFDRLRSREWLNGNGEVTPISKPFGRWRKKIDSFTRRHEYSRKATANEDDTITIQWQLIEGQSSTSVRQAVEAEFKDLGFGYTEAVSELLKTSRHTNLAFSLLPSRKMDGAADSWSSATQSSA
ncbi:hypothetical protein BKA65DRAFT_480195 [Rhexocercosporidium sp. MPI-PUGE-AT-0058]|nr:hypothetical protein BKA65DRAFT_480195 [Rhexocercosporidium sp. MPI-PUGE-AT-0058]